MAAGPQLLDVNTGLPQQTVSQQYPRQENIVSTSGGRTDVANTNQATQSNQQQSTFSSSLNTTPAALDALHSLISSLTEHPAVSEAELNQKAPLASPVYSPSGWKWYDPATGRYMNAQEAQVLNSQRKIEQQKIQRAAGTVPAGTAEQTRQQTERATEISRDRAQQGAYGKDAAMADAGYLINKAIADALRAAEPGITMASEGAGTSKSTFRAQALQEAATRGGVEGGALGANLSVAYGQIYNQLGGILEQLTRIDPNGPTAMLLQALNISKGIAQAGQSDTNVQGQQNTTGQTTTQKGPETETKNVVRDNTPLTQGGLPPVTSPTNIAAAQPTNPYYAFSEGTSSPISVTPTPTFTSASPSAFDVGAAYDAVVAGNEEY